MKINEEEVPVMNKKYMIDTDENKAFMKMLTEDLLCFGHRFPSEAGSSYYLGDDGTPWKERPRETWITCRMAHVYSIGTLLGHDGSEELVDAAIKGITGELYDGKHGGWYPGITANGEILENKQCYAHAFVILAATSALLAGRPGAKELLDEALELYDLRFWNDEEGLACDTWNTEFTRLDDYRGLNANMHTVEAFLAVADATGREEYRVRAGRIIDHVINWAKDNNWRIPEHFTRDWVADLECNKEQPADQFKPYGATPGHGIEWGRLITQWALSTYDSDSNDSKPYIEAAENLYNRAIADAWNADGAPGIVYTTDWNGKPVVHDRMHWTLAEAINTSAVLYRVTNNSKYADEYAMFMQYLDEVVLDHVNGSWYHQLNSNNELIGTVWPGKSDIYHALQATLIPYSKVNVSIAAAVRGGTIISNIDVVALGELLIDFTLNGTSNQGNPLFEANPGGAPCNVLAILQKLGKNTAFIGKVGKDQFGKQLRQTIEEIGICSDYLKEDPEIPTTLAFVHNMPDGDRSFSFYRKPGADVMLNEDDISGDIIENAKIFHFGTLSMTHDNARKATLKALEIARKAGVIISLDPNLREPLWDSLDAAKEQILTALSYCDVLKISDNEIQFLTGEDDYDEGIRKLREQFDIKLICLTMGKDGSRAYYKDIRVCADGFRQDKVVDTTGAGDTFCGCVLNYICDNGLDNLSEDNLKEMLVYANAAASLITTKKGAIRSMPTREEIDSLVSK